MNKMPKGWEQGALFAEAADRLYIPIVETQLSYIAENTVQYSGAEISNPVDCYKLLAPMLENKDREHLIALALNSKGRPNGIYTVSIGGLSHATIHPREVFKTALMMCAASIVLAHNHPSGDPEPSRRDIEITEKLVSAGDLLGITISDHLIIGHKSYVSLKEQYSHIFE